MAENKMTRRINGKLSGGTPGYTDAGASTPGPTTGQQAEQERMYQESVKRQKNAARRFIKQNPTTSV